VPVGTLYVVATPIGNLEDFSPRGARVLAEVDLIAAEDTRHSAKLLQHYGVQTKVVSIHDYNERAKTPQLLEMLRAGKSIALVSDAGTPLLSDPGFHLVRAARAANVTVVPIPGPCAAIAALSVAGLPTDRFAFEGFPPPRAAARRAALATLRTERRTMVFYESSHRIVESLSDMADVFGADRPAALAREITKRFETIRDGTLADLNAYLVENENERLGEFVVLIAGAREEAGDDAITESDRILGVLLQEVPLKEAVKLAARLTGGHKNELYDRALSIKAASSKKS